MANEEADDVVIDLDDTPQPEMAEEPADDPPSEHEPPPEPEPEPEPADEDPILAAWLDEEIPEETEVPARPPAPLPAPEGVPREPERWFDQDRFNADPGGYLSQAVDERAAVQADAAARRALETALPQILGPVANQLERLQDTSRIEAARLTGDVKRSIDTSYRKELSKDNSFRQKGDVYNIVDHKIKEDFRAVQNCMRQGKIRELAERAEIMMSPLYARGTLALAKLAAEEHGRSKPLNPGTARVESPRKAPAAPKHNLSPDVLSVLDEYGYDPDEYAGRLKEYSDVVED